MKMLTQSQSFSQFILDRIERSETDYEILFFDESIKAKKNKSILRFTKETTPFLKDSSFAITTCISSLPPNDAGLDMEICQKAKLKDMYAWDDRCLVPARHILPLVSESDMRMMRSHTTQIVQKARLQLSQKSDLSKWMRSKMRNMQPLSAKDFQTEDERRDMLEERLAQVSKEIDRYENAYVSTQTEAQVDTALSILHYQNVVLAKASDEEQLVDSNNQQAVQQVLGRLIRVITIYEDYKASLDKSATRLDIEATTAKSEIGLSPKMIDQWISDTTKSKHEESLESFMDPLFIRKTTEISHQSQLTDLFVAKSETSLPHTPSERRAPSGAASEYAEEGPEKILHKSNSQILPFQLQLPPHLPLVREEDVSLPRDLVHQEYSLNMPAMTKDNSDAIVDEMVARLLMEIESNRVEASERSRQQSTGMPKETGSEYERGK